MVEAAVYKKDTIEEFGSIDSVVIRVEPRQVSYSYKFAKEAVAKPFLSIRDTGVIVDTRKAEKLIAQTKKLRKKHLWFLWKMYAPSRAVINSAISVIQYCPSDLFLEGYYVSNYGNGTVALMRRSVNYSITINIGVKSLTYAKLSIADHKLVNAGECPIEKNAVEKLFETL